MSSLLSTRKTGVVAVVDVGSNSAACAIVALSPRGPSEILSSVRVALPFEKRPEPQQIAALAGAVKEASEKALSAYAILPTKRKTPQDVYVIVRAPWTTSKTVSKSVSYEREQKILPATIAGIAKEIMVSENTSSEVIFERSVIKIELNGYETAKAESKKARRVGVTVLMSTIRSEFQSAIGSALQTVFTGRTLQWRSHTRALMTTLHAQTPLARNAAVLDIASEGSSLFVLRKFEINTQTVSSEGLQAILSRISVKSAPEGTLSILKLIEKDQCTTEACIAIQTAIASTEPELVKTFGELFASMSSARRLPDDLFLLSHPEITPWLSRVFSRIDFTQFTTTTKPFTVHTRTLDDFRPFISATEASTDMSLLFAVSLVHINSAN